MESDRRRFVTVTAALGLGQLVLPGGGVRADEKEKEEVSAPEDLMREHGVLNRILLIFEEGLRRKESDLSPDVFHKPALLVRKFVEDYHEKLEENFIFPEFEKKKRLVDLVKVLREQHEAGRKVTDVVLRNAVPERLRKEAARKELTAACRAFIRMYRPHEAREDTVLFPELHRILPAKRIEELGDLFEKEENRLFGDEGFEKTVEQVAVLERQLGIHDLSQFTPK
jgi:hemerythrin-like domain-containing protein